MATRISARDFNRDVSAAKRAASAGPVVITDRGNPAHVLLTYSEFVQMRGGKRNLADLLRMDSDEDIDFDPGRIEMTPRAVEL